MGIRVIWSSETNDGLRHTVTGWRQNTLYKVLVRKDQPDSFPYHVSFSRDINDTEIAFRFEKSINLNEVSKDWWTLEYARVLLQLCTTGLKSLTVTKTIRVCPLGNFCFDPGESNLLKNVHTFRFVVFCESIYANKETVGSIPPCSSKIRPFWADVRRLSVRAHCRIRSIATICNRHWFRKWKFKHNTVGRKIHHTKLKLYLAGTRSTHMFSPNDLMTVMWCMDQIGKWIVCKNVTKISTGKLDQCRSS